MFNSRKLSVIGAVIVVAIIVVSVLTISYNNNKISNTIIKEIDNTSDENGNCEIDLNNIVDFKWDKAVFYTKLDAFQFGMIFTYQNKIVYKEIIRYNVEERNIFWISIGSDPHYREQSVSITPESAVIIAKTEIINNEHYYTIIFEN